MCNIKGKIYSYFFLEVSFWKLSLWKLRHKTLGHNASGNWFGEKFTINTNAQIQRNFLICAIGGIKITIIDAYNLLSLFAFYGNLEERSLWQWSKNSNNMIWKGRLRFHVQIWTKRHCYIMTYQCLYNNNISATVHFYYKCVLEKASPAKMIFGRDSLERKRKSCDGKFSKIRLNHN